MSKKAIAAWCARRTETYLEWRAAPSPPAERDPVDVNELRMDLGHLGAAAANAVSGHLAAAACLRPVGIDYPHLPLLMCP